MWGLCVMGEGMGWDRMLLTMEVVSLLRRWSWVHQSLVTLWPTAG